MRGTQIWSQNGGYAKVVHILPGNIQETTSKKWTWAGHLARRQDDRWTNKLTDWTPRAYTRGRGRQSRIWMDNIEEYGSVTWKRTAQDRVESKADEEAFLLQWNEIG